MSEELIGPMKAAEIAGCHDDTVRRAIEAGFLPAQRVGRNWIIKRKDVEAWIEAGKPNRRRKASHDSDEHEEPTQDEDTGED